MENIRDQLNTIMLVQECDQKIFRYQRELDEIPNQIKGMQSRLEKYSEDAEKLHEITKKTQVAIKSLEGAIDVQRERITTLRRQQFEISDNKSYRLMEQEIGKHESEILDKETEILKLMETLDGLEQQEANIKSELASEQARIDNEISELNARQEELSNEIANQKERRDKISVGVSSELLTNYTRIMNHLKDAAVVGIENGAYKGCNMKMPAQIQHNNRSGDMLLICDFCGRLLFNGN